MIRVAIISPNLHHARFEEKLIKRKLHSIGIDPIEMFTFSHIQCNRDADFKLRAVSCDYVIKLENYHLMRTWDRDVIEYHLRFMDVPILTLAMFHQFIEVLSGLETQKWQVKKKYDNLIKKINEVRKPLNPLFLSENESPDYYLDKLREEHEKNEHGKKNETKQVSGRGIPKYKGNQ